MRDFLFIEYQTMRRQSPLHSSHKDDLIRVDREVAG